MSYDFSFARKQFFLLIGFIVAIGLALTTGGFLAGRLLTPGVNTLQEQKLPIARFPSKALPVPLTTVQPKTLLGPHAALAAQPGAPAPAAASARPDLTGLYTLQYGLPQDADSAQLLVEALAAENIPATAETYLAASGIPVVVVRAGLFKSPDEAAIMQEQQAVALRISIVVRPAGIL